MWSVYAFVCVVVCVGYCVCVRSGVSFWVCVCVICGVFVCIIDCVIWKFVCLCVVCFCACLLVFDCGFACLLCVACESV